MTRFVLIGALVAFALAVFAIVDIAIVERDRVRHLPKPVWMILVILLPLIGAVFWFFFGRARPGRERATKRVLGPEDDPAFLAKLREQEEAERRIRDLEQQLRDLDDDKPQS